MTPLQRRIQIRLSVLTGLMAAAVAVVTLTETQGLVAALLWGAGAGAAAAGVFALWFQVKENRPPEDD